MLFLCGLRGEYMKLINENDMIFYGDLSCNRTNSENAWKIRVLQRITNALVLDRGNFQEVLKNREGEKNIESATLMEFKKVRLSDLPNDEIKIREKYHSKKIWLTI